MKIASMATPEYAAPEPPLWLPGLDPEYTVRFLDGKGNLHWESNPGPQTWASLCQYEELLVGGRRGGGKSKFLIAKPAMGDPTLPADDPARFSFLNDRDF